MSDVKIGELLGPDAQRDAIHIAVAPVVAAYDLSPGDHVGLNDHGKAERTATPIGIVDPFLRTSTCRVKKGEVFYLFLYPNTVTGMRHHWTHPAFAAEAPNLDTSVEASKAWLVAYVIKTCPYDFEDDGPEGAYAKFLERATRGEIFYCGTDCHSPDEVEKADELYQHLSVVLGRIVTQASFHTFSCSC